MDADRAEIPNDLAGELAGLAGSAERWVAPGDRQGGNGLAALPQLRSTAQATLRSARAAGAGAVTSGRWLAELLVDVASRIPVRDRAMLEAQHSGLTGEALAAELVRHAARVTAAIGAAGGALVGLSEVTPPSWVALPIELLVEVALVSAVELKLVAELHEALGHPIAGRGVDKGVLVARAWADQRGVSAKQVLAGDGLAAVVGGATRREVIRAVKRRLAGRLGRSLSTLVPLMAGAAAAAQVNRRATRRLGERIIGDLHRRF